MPNLNYLKKCLRDDNPLNSSDHDLDTAGHSTQD